LDFWWNPQTNPSVQAALGTDGWPKLTDQGLVLKPGRIGGKSVLVIGGGSRVATLWAVYELVERWGCAICCTAMSCRRRPVGSACPSGK